MLLLRTETLPADGARWIYELKLDGYRAVAFTRDGAVHLRSRNDSDFNVRYPAVLRGLANLPDDTVIDGEVDRVRRERPSVVQRAAELEQRQHAAGLLRL